VSFHPGWIVNRHGHTSDWKYKSQATKNAKALNRCPLRRSSRSKHLCSGRNTVAALVIRPFIQTDGLVLRCRQTTQARRACQWHALNIHADIIPGNALTAFSTFSAPRCTQCNTLWSQMRYPYWLRFIASNWVLKLGPLHLARLKDDQLRFLRHLLSYWNVIVCILNHLVLDVFIKRFLVSHIYIIKY